MASPIQHMGVDHRRPHISMTQQLLQCPDVVPTCDLSYLHHSFATHLLQGATPEVAAKRFQVAAKILSLRRRSLCCGSDPYVAA